MEDKIWRLRTWIYILGILAFTTAIIYKCSTAHAIEIEQECTTGESDGDDTDSNDFWPPDMIPHPNPPLEPVHDDRMS